MQKVTVSCRQISPVVGDIAYNRSIIERESKDAASSGAKIVIFPELAATGYSFRNEEEAYDSSVTEDSDLIRAFASLAVKCNIVLAIGYVEHDKDQKIYNSAIIITPSGRRLNYRKAHLWDNEKKLFSSGDGFPPSIDTKYGRLGLLICYDLEFPEWVRAIALQGVDLLCAPVNWPYFQYPHGERPCEIVRIQANAAINRMAIAACDRSGRDRGGEWLGGSVIVDADGYPVTTLLLRHEGSVDASIDLLDSRNKKISNHNDVMKDRRTSLYSQVPQLLQNDSSPS